MKKKLFFIFLSIMVGFALFGQDKGKEKGKDAEKDKKTVETSDPNVKKLTADQIYTEITLEDFESTAYDAKKNLDYRISSDQSANVSIRDQYPAPIKNSKKYLGIKIYGRKGDVLQIVPAKPLIIDKFCTSISVWVYGKNFTGELSMLVKDSTGIAHRMILGKLDFLGWRKMTVKLPTEIIQQDKNLTQKNQIQLLKFLYDPGNLDRIPLWNYFYIDDITAIVRDKYVDKQVDEW